MASNGNTSTGPKRHRTNRRRQYLINPAFQWKYTLTLGGAVFVISSALSTALYGVLHQQARLRAVDPAGYIADVGGVILLFGVGFAFLSALGLGLWTLLITHRISGPLYVLGGYFEELRLNRFPKPRALRRNDEFKDLHADFGKATAALRHRKAAELAVLTKAVTALRSITGTDTIDSTETLDVVTCQLDNLRREAAESLGQTAENNPSTVETSDKRLRSPVAVG